MSKNNNMSKNKIGETIHDVGIAIIVLGCAASLAYVIHTEDGSFIIIGPILSAILGMCFIGFGEIIRLLQEIVTQNSIIIDSGIREMIDLQKKSVVRQSVIIDILKDKSEHETEN